MAKKRNSEIRNTRSRHPTHYIFLPIAYMIHSTVKDPKIAELVQELREFKKYHGFTMAIAREADTNYNNLCSILSKDEE